ncbi:hypothetical protein BC628DRAFT_1411310 [Trametes gibbosa]|nr:hypothetical protein BC628DRAFT_1411310 [Trametes gibbosa]
MHYSHYHEAICLVTVDRDQISAHYGGSPMDTFPKPSEKRRAQHRRRTGLMCINLLWTPRAPQWSGHTGLYFDISLPVVEWMADTSHAERQTLFVKLKSRQKSAPSLTAQQWCGLPSAVRSILMWTKNIHGKQWGKSVRARIHIRQTLGREATNKEAKPTEGLFKHISVEDIDAAFVAGHERLRIWSMQCVAYEEDFQRGFVPLTKCEL